MAWKIKSLLLVRLCISLALVFSLAVIPVVAQTDLHVTGKVIDGSGIEVIGASVVVKGTTNGSVTGVDGTFSISVPSEKSVLQISFIGYESQEIIVGKRRTFEITLLENSQMLEDVVVVAYGTQSKATLTGSLVSADTKKLAKAPVASITNVLAGSLPGVSSVQTTGQPGQDAADIKIRGVGSLTSSNPLVLVDGVEREFSQIDPNEIENFSVLKDASATAVFGVRGANGVILITTKRGTIGKPTISFSSLTGLQQPMNYVEQTGSYEFARFWNIKMRNDGETDRKKYFTREDIEAFRTGSDPIMHPNSDWRKMVFNKFFLQTKNNINISGGTDNLRYFVSLGYLYQNGIMDTRNNYNRLNFRANFDFEATDWLKVGSNIVISNSEQYNPENSAWLAAYNMPSLMPVYDYTRSDDEAFPEKFASPQQIGLTNNFSNPVAIAKYNNNSLNETFQVMANFFAELSLIPNKLKFKTSYSQDFSLIRGRVYVQPYLVSSLQQNSESRLTKTDTNYYNYIWDNTLTYTDSWGSHNLNVLLGQSARQEQMRKLEGKASNVPGDYDEYLYLTQGNSTGREVSDDGSCYRGLSYFARASYDYAGKYLLSLTMRADGSSKYQNKWGYFPSVGAAWVMSDENFFKKQHAIDYLKVRASWGQLGNDHVSASDGFASITTGISASGVFGNTTLPGFQNTSYFSWLGWEKVEEFNAGVNFALLDSRLNVDVDYYNRITKNAVISTTLPFSTQTLAGNNGEIRNSGFDIQLNWSDKIGKDFSYYAGMNLSTLRNRVKSLNGAPYIYGGSAESRTINLVGEEMQSYYGYKVLGVYQNQAQIDADPIAKANGLEPGDFIYEDQEPHVKEYADRTHENVLYGFRPDASREVRWYDYYRCSCGTDGFRGGDLLG